MERPFERVTLKAARGDATQTFDLTRAQAEGIAERLRLQGWTVWLRRTGDRDYASQADAAA